MPGGTGAWDVSRTHALYTHICHFVDDLKGGHVASEDTKLTNLQIPGRNGVKGTNFYNHLC